MRRRSLTLVLLALVAGAPLLRAEQQPPTDPRPFDPYRAEKSMEIGKFYLKKGGYDAAIERFEDAVRARDGFALPYRYIGEAREKKGEKPEAIAAYRKYLEMLPTAQDGNQIRKRIVKLTREVEREKRKHSR